MIEALINSIIFLFKWSFYILAVPLLVLTGITLFFVALWVIYDIVCQFREDTPNTSPTATSKPPLPSQFFGLD